MIWKYDFGLEVLNTGQGRTLMSHLQIDYVEKGEDYLVARMPVTPDTHNPIGIMHGGAHIVLAESVGSLASNLCLDNSIEYALGLEVNGNHIKSIKEGYVYATARPVYLGRNTHVWEIKNTNEYGELLHICRLTTFVKQILKP